MPGVRRAPYNSAEVITPSDTVDILPEGTPPSRYMDGLYVGGAGNITVTFFNNRTRTFVGVPAGTTLEINVKRVNATLTTATSMLALFVD